MRKTFYSEGTEVKMKRLFESLSEKDRRLYAGVEAGKLPHGGINYLSHVFSCDCKTIRSGIKEVSDTSFNTSDRIRRIGGGRKKTIEQLPNLEKVFLEIIHDHTAGDPMNEKVLWTDLTSQEICEYLLKRGFKVGAYVVKQLLNKHGYVKRSASKEQSIGSSENRDDQFVNISRLKKEFKKEGNPIISIDTKKKNC